MGLKEREEQRKKAEKGRKPVASTVASMMSKESLREEQPDPIGASTDQYEKIIEESLLKRYQKRAEELGISLQEYLSLKILLKLDDLSVRAYIEE